MLRTHLGFRSGTGSRRIDARSRRHIALDGPLRQSLGVLAVSTIAALAIVAIDQNFNDAGQAVADRVVQDVVVQDVVMQGVVVNTANKVSASASLVTASSPEPASAYSPAARASREALHETAGAGTTEGRADRNARSGASDSQFFQSGDSPPDYAYRTVRSVAVTALAAQPGATPTPALQAIESAAPLQTPRPAMAAPDPSMENATPTRPEMSEKPRPTRTAAVEASSKSSASSSQTPTECLPEPLKNVLADLRSRFPDVTIVSTTHLHTKNHWSNSAREKMHGECKAVDVKTAGSPTDVLSFLRARSEVGGINSYRAGVVHFDLNPQFKAVASQRPRRS